MLDHKAGPGGRLSAPAGYPLAALSLSAGCGGSFRREQESLSVAEEDAPMGLLAALSPLFFAAATPVAAQCAPIAGWDQVLADERSRIIVLGEMHGSNEIPAVFADAVCLTAQSRRVVVAVEQPSSDQSAVDAFIASDGGEAARSAFLQAAMWNGPMKDGRSSEAYFRLFEQLRQMRAAGVIAAVVAFQPAMAGAPPTPEQYEIAMANLVRAARQADTTVLALVGNVHAMLTPVPWEPRYTAMAGHLPAEEVLTLNASGAGGEAWNCRSRDDCGAKPAFAPDSHSRGVELNAAGDGPYSGVLHLGVATTASPPQVAAAG